MDYYGLDETGSRKSCSLLTSILDCLYQCMLHDTEGLFQKDVFKMIMQPLVDQVYMFTSLPIRYVHRAVFCVKTSDVLKFINCC